MSLIKWSPLFYEPFEDVDKMFERMGAMTPRLPSSIMPPVDMYETDASVVVETPLAGVDPNKIEISIDNGILSIKGASERKTEVDDKNYYRKEVRYGTIYRQVPLPTRVVDGKAEASFENGILKIVVPKAEEKKAIKVNVTMKKKD